MVAIFRQSVQGGEGGSARGVKRARLPFGVKCAGAVGQQA